MKNAITLLYRYNSISISLLQRACRIGYSHACAILALLDGAGLITFNGHYYPPVKDEAEAWIWYEANRAAIEDALAEYADDTPIKVLFLDIDGVLNSVKYDRERRETDGNVDVSRLPILRRIVEETGARIVLSTTWRRHWDRDEAKCDGIGRQLADLFAEYGLDIYDKTPWHPDGDRAEEIMRWLDTGDRYVTAFAILDDIRFGWGELEEFLVRTDERIGYGLEESHADRVIRILNGEITDTEKL